MTGEADWREPLPPGFRWPAGVRAAACLTFDVDAESPILFEHPETAGWLDVMSHQAYGARTGVVSGGSQTSTWERMRPVPWATSQRIASRARVLTLSRVRNGFRSAHVWIPSIRVPDSL